MLMQSEKILNTVSICGQSTVTNTVID